ncbi:response regulator transcription factor [Plectonema cf. radiosum LEGE 06105]|uniref:Response regulator transcription factor n=1 Tax=Plectonema cf. radiosum LEGE 06105 TaxID=945769 RepID=A0A8J7F4E8_9CYAN|nr:response regulator transcription factor [Plectonema radiosum]MBE9214952.1 response regulator transcription factor [Plectonema cf. radiosum LEGE 06105]
MEELNYDYHQKEHYDLPINNQLEINSTVNYPQSAFQGTDKIRIVIIEDLELTLIGIRTALHQYENIEIVGDALNAKDGLTLLNRTQPQIVIIDIGLPSLNGIQLIREIKTKYPKMKVIILTLNSDKETVLTAFAAGANSYCMKDIKFDKLIEAIHLTYLGKTWIDPTVAHFVLEQALFNSLHFNKSSLDEEMLNLYTLTGRELEILRLIVDGSTNGAIADQLHITIGTVKSHVRNILNKVGAEDRTQAAVHALRYGLVD